jgi:hypothetical protein
MSALVAAVTFQPVAVREIEVQFVDRDVVPKHTPEGETLILGCKLQRAILFAYDRSGGLRSVAAG